uniref:Uncharacterized protein n=1 Tax=Vitis vinifera TaxID=29760 RepID=A5ATH5_VITVI|nr:hypothetical protein VITISV_026464 [Vitis vinifera]
MKYVWIEESPNTASDCSVAPPKKGDGLRSRCGTTRKGEEHFPRHVQGLEWRKSGRSFAGKTVWRADGDKNPQKRYVQGAGRKIARGRRVAALLVLVPSQKLEISSRRSFWYGRCRKNRSPENFAGKFAGKFRRKICQRDCNVPPPIGGMTCLGRRDGVPMDHVNNWRETTLILTSVLFLASGIWFLGVFLDSVDRFKLDSENQSVQSKATMKPLLEGEDDEMPDTSTGP